MIRPSLRPAAPLLAVLLLLAAGCRDSTAPEVFDPVGSMSFAYQGLSSGSFSATGEMNLGPTTLLQPVTGATAYLEEGVLALLAARTTSAGRLDFFSLLLGNVERTGKLPIDATQCMGDSMAVCRLGVFMLDVDPAELLEMADIEAIVALAYVMVMGEVNVTTLTPMRIRGTFTGYALRPSDQNPQLLIISGGTFDLPRRPR